jgi:hypothetical protein
LPFVKYSEAIDWADRLARCPGREALQVFAGFLELDVRVSRRQRPEFSEPPP